MLKLRITLKRHDVVCQLTRFNQAFTFEFNSYHQHGATWGDGGNESQLDANDHESK